MRYSHELMRHLSRGLSGSTRRHCLGCGHRWRSPERGYLRSAQATVALSGLLLTGFSAWFILRAPPPAAARKPLRFIGVKAPPSALPQARKNAPEAETPVEADISQTPGEDPDQAGAVARPPESEAFLMTPMPEGEGPSTLSGQALEDVGQLLKQMTSIIAPSGTDSRYEEVIKTDKKELWRKYGSYFGSKEEAKAKYDEYIKTNAPK